MVYFRILFIIIISAKYVKPAFLSNFFIFRSKENNLLHSIYLLVYSILLLRSYRRYGSRRYP